MQHSLVLFEGVWREKERKIGLHTKHLLKVILEIILTIWSYQEKRQKLFKLERSKKIIKKKVWHIIGININYMIKIF